MFTKGWKGGPGRPAQSKDTAKKIRNRLFRILLRRIVRDKDLDSVSTSELLRFFSSVIPRDISLTQEDKSIIYLSNVPRPELEQESTPGLALENKIAVIAAAEVEEEEKEEGESE